MPSNQMVATNCFAVNRVPAATYTLYDVSFAKETSDTTQRRRDEPAIPKDHKKKKADLIFHLQTLVQPQFFQPKFLYDGEAVGFAHPHLGQQLGAHSEFRVRLRDNAIPAVGARNVFIVRFRRTDATITPTDVNEFVARGGHGDVTRRSYILNFLQLMIRQDSNNRHPNNGRAYFPASTDPREGPWALTKGFIELRRGIFHSVRPAQGGLIVVIDTTVGIFYRSGRVEDAFGEFIHSRTRGPLNPRDLEAARKWFRGVKITEDKSGRGREGGKRVIKGFHHEGILYRFRNDDGQLITIQDHYKRVHNIILTRTKLPGIIVREDPLEILPMELCKIEPNQLFKKAIPEWAIREMVRHATLKPAQKMQRIQAATGHYQASETLIASGMGVSDRPLVVPATIMPAPRIAFQSKTSDKTKHETIPVQGGKWNVVGQTLLSSVQRCHWVIINFAPSLSDNRVAEQELTFRECAKRLGLPIQRPLFKRTVNASWGSEPVLTALNQMMVEVRNETGEIYSKMLEGKQFFILCILESEAAGVRNTIKHWGDVERGIITQCVRLNKLPAVGADASHTGPASQYWNNVVLKVNARLGGKNSTITESSTYAEMQKTATMIVGADVGHPSPGVRKPSVASLVYSLDRDAIRYSARTALQEPRTEIIADLFDMMGQAMREFQTNIRGCIDNIVFYRDGVSEGEFDIVKNTEIEEIKRAMQRVWDTTPNIQQMKQKGHKVPLPRLTFIVVGKRHRTLLFPHGLMPRDQKTGNCPAGVVVDQRITQPQGHFDDFYLLSHSAIQGTSRPSHYTVLLNEVCPGQPQSLQDLSYALCHVYAKATRSVSIPAPVYYADRVCGRDAFHFAPEVEESLRASDAGSTASGSTAPFNLKVWKDAWKPRHGRLDGNMYFL